MPYRLTRAYKSYGKIHIELHIPDLIERPENPFQSPYRHMELVRFLPQWTVLIINQINFHRFPQIVETDAYRLTIVFASSF